MEDAVTPLRSLFAFLPFLFGNAWCGDNDAHSSRSESNKSTVINGCSLLLLSFLSRRATRVRCKSRWACVATVLELKMTIVHVACANGCEDAATGSQHIRPG